MRKLRLNLEALRIESFTTGASSTRRGTVQGQSYLEPTQYLCGGGGDIGDTNDCESGGSCVTNCQPPKVDVSTEPTFCGDIC